MSGITRRWLLNSVAAAAGIAAGGGIARQFGLWRRAWPRTPYDDLLDRLSLREEAITLGLAVLAAKPHFAREPAAARLRAGLKTYRNLGNLAAADAAAGRVAELHGWILPAAVTEISALAAVHAPIAPSGGPI